MADAPARRDLPHRLPRRAIRVRARRRAGCQTRVLHRAGRRPGRQVRRARHLGGADGRRQILAQHPDGAQKPRRRGYLLRLRRRPQRARQGGGSGVPDSGHADMHRAPHPRCAALRFVSWADRKDVAAALRPLYTADNEQAALGELEKLEHKHGDKYPTVIRTFRGRWEQFVPFLSYPQEIRRMLYTTNAVESLNSQLRRCSATADPSRTRTPSSRSSFSRSRTPRPTGELPRTGTVPFLSSTSFFEGRLPA
jgi:hypothetical protein